MLQPVFQHSCLPAASYTATEGLCAPMMVYLPDLRQIHSLDFQLRLTSLQFSLHFLALKHCFVSRSHLYYLYPLTNVHPS